MTGDESNSLLKALEFFDGKIVVRRNPEADYSDPTEGLAETVKLSADEDVERRRLIANFLLSPNPPTVLLTRLAGAFAPDGDENAGDRRADLTHRRGSRPTDIMRAAQLVVEVEHLHAEGMTFEAARAMVAKKHGLSESTVKSALERHSQLARSLRENLNPKK